MSAVKLLCRVGTAILSAAFATFVGGAVSAQSLSNDVLAHDTIALQEVAPRPEAPRAAPTEDDVPAPLRRQIVSYSGDQPPGTIIIDTAHAFLYLTLGDGKALRYGIGVGRQGFTWSGIETLSRKSEWPDWIPPAEMIARQPYLPRWVGGGPGNPLGARALYLGNTDYRIHGTNNPGSIGKHVSSGCIRMRDADVIDLYDRVSVGTKVVVLPNDQGAVAFSDQRDVAQRGVTPKDVASQNVTIESNHGAMTARIMVRSTHQVESNGNPTAFGLY